MRLWHYKLISFLPKSQLLAQWRELNSIFKKQDKHILINYIYQYDKLHLYSYSKLVINEMKKRGYKIKSYENFINYFKGNYNSYDLVYYENSELKDMFVLHHNMRYLCQCFFNLQEKYDRGQKDFDKKTYDKLLNFYKDELYKEEFYAS